MPIAQKQIRNVLTFFGVLFVLTFLFIFTLSLIKGYPDFIRYSLKLIQQEQRLDIALSFISKVEFHLLQSLLFVWIVLLSLGLVFIKKITAPVEHFLSGVMRHLSRVVQDIKSSRGKFALIIPLACSVYYAIALPVTYDEAWTYLYFTINSPLVSASFYPAPNNHILFSLISNVTHFLPWVSCLFALRITSIVVSLITWAVLFSFIKSSFNEKTALLLTGVCSMLFLSVYYSYMGRGYALVLFFFILSVLAAWKLIRQPDNFYWIVFIMTTVLGCYTMPSYVFAFSGVAVVLLYFTKGNKRKFFLSLCCIIVLTLLLYLPILVVNGYEAVLFNPWIVRQPFTECLQKLLPFFSKALQEISGIPIWITGMLMAGSSIWMILKKKWSLMTFLGIMIITPFLIALLFGIIPYTRTFVFLGVLISAYILLPFGDELNKLSFPLVMAMTLIVQIGLTTSFQAQIKRYDSVYFSYHELSQHLIGPDKRYYFNADLFDTTFAFEMKTHGYQMKKATNCYPTLKHEMNADTVNGYDYIIIDKDVDRTVLKKPLFSTTRINVYP